MSPQKQWRSFPSISACNASETASYESIAAHLDGTLLISRQPPPRPRPPPIPPPRHRFLLLLRSPRHPDSHLHFISFSALKIHDIELASRAVLPRFYAADVRTENFEVFDKCKRKVVVTANQTVMVEPFVKDFLGGDKLLGAEIEVNPKTKKATGFVKKPGVLVGKLKRLAVLKEFSDEVPDIGIGDRSSDHDDMSLCKY
ncbi:unnamed protein product [Malus baccata var. baccata]